MNDVWLGVILAVTLVVIFVRQWFVTRGQPNHVHALLFGQSEHQQERQADAAAHPARTFVVLAVLYGGGSWLFSLTNHRRSGVAIVVSAVLYAFTMVALVRRKQRKNGALSTSSSSSPSQT
jgi:hypothetical protein